MTPAINLGLGGLSGWKILQRTEARQIEALRKDSIVQRSTTYLRENIDKVRSPEALVKDYRLLSGVLSAFGLENDISNKAFIRKILESDPADQKALVNRLSDKRYLRMAQTIGTGGTPAELADRLTEAFVTREHERRVGGAHEELRLAMNGRRELQQFAGRTASDRTLWYEVMGNPPLRKLMEGALGLSRSLGKLPVERQNQEFMAAAQRTFGTTSLAALAEPARTEKVIQNYLARSQLTESPVANRYSAAMSLLAPR
jgi:hypothetical protein